MSAEHCAVHLVESATPESIANEARFLVDRVKDLRRKLHLLQRNDQRSMIGRNLSKAQLALELAVIAGVECTENGEWK